MTADVVLFLVFVLVLVPVAAGADTLTADFTARDSFTQGFAPFTAEFVDKSTLAASWEWNFGDGQTSAEPNPTHTYTNPGTYTVSLTVRSMTGPATNTKTMTNYIVVAPDPMSGAASTTTVSQTTTISPTSYYPATTTTTVPTTTATPALSGTIAITSSPTGAMVFLDNVQQGITPITLYNIAVGTHGITVHEKGYVDNVTPVLVEYQKTFNHQVDLVKVGAPVSTPVTTLPVTPTMTVMETAEAQAMAAAAAPASTATTSPGSIHIYCIGCLERMYNGRQVTSFQYSIFEVDSNTGKETERYFGQSKTEEAIRGNLIPGKYKVKASPENFKAQWQYVNVNSLHETPVSFNGADFVQVPGFEAVLAVFALAGIIGFRRYRQ
jgi:PKD repeat protein